MGYIYNNSAVVRMLAKLAYIPEYQVARLLKNYSKLTRNAISKFQEEHNLEVTGICNEETFNKLENICT